MSEYAGFDVSDKTTTICVVAGQGVIVRRGVAPSDPDALARWLARHCPGLVRVVLETGPLSTFLYHGLAERGVPVVCICARHAKGVLSTRVNKSDVHDAEGLAQLCRTGWFKRVHMKASATHIDRAGLRIRAQLVTSRIAMANQLRGLLKLFGLRLGKVTTPNKRAERLVALYHQRPDLEDLFAPLVAALEAIELGLRLGFGKDDASSVILNSKVRLSRSGLALRLVHTDGRPTAATTVDTGLVALLQRARTWWDRLAQGDIDIATIAREEQVNDSWVSRVVRLNFLAPPIVEAIFNGTQPVSVTAASLRSADIPDAWDEQLAYFGMRPTTR